MARRIIGSAVALTAAVVVAGCGGGGDPAAFAQTTDRTCRDVSTAVATLRQQLVRTHASDERAALEAVIGRYAASVEGAAQRLADADPPKDDEDFRDEAVQKLRDHATTLRAAATAAGRGRLSDSLSARITAAGTTTMPTIPAAVVGDAPSCKVAAR